MNNGLVITPQLVIPWAEIHFQASRASGPGGQHVNTSDTRVELRWNIQTSQVLSDTQRARLLHALANRLNRQGEILLSSGRRRSQHRNKEDVCDRLTDLVRDALAHRKRRVPTAPSTSVKERRLLDKKRRAEKKVQRRKPDPAD